MKKFAAFLVATFLILLNCLTVTAQTPIAIRSESELKAISGSKKSYYLANDITLTGDFTPISVFSGDFDGRDKKIVNLKISKNAQTTDTVFVGLFEKLDGGTVKNLTLENVKISVTGGENIYVGAVCGRVDSVSISNCRVSGEISAISGNANVFLGGIAGQNNGEINCCENSAKINVDASRAIVGGIVGDHARADYILEKCINLGSITVSGVADTNYVGGIVGKTVKTVENCANYGAIKLAAAGYAYVGGIVSSLTNGEIKNCYSGGVLNCDAKTEGFLDPIAAEHKNEFSNNFYLDTVISNISTTDIKTASALDSKSVSNVSIFSGFDFNNVWKMGANGPVLKCITTATIEIPQPNENTNNTSSSVSGTSSNMSSTSSAINDTSSNMSSTSSAGSNNSSDMSSTSSSVSNISSSSSQSSVSANATSSTQPTVSNVSSTESSLHDGPMTNGETVQNKKAPSLWIFVVIFVVIIAVATAVVIFIKNNKDYFSK